MTDSNSLRKEILQQRDKLGKDQLTSHSARITSRLLNLDALAKAKSVFVYVSFRSEVMTLDLIDLLIQRNITVTVPLTHVKEKRIDAIKITNRRDDLVPGYCDIPEPRKDLWKTDILAPEEIDTILLPGSVFDKKGGTFWIWRRIL